MTLIETADHERVAQTIESEIANANLSIPNLPMAGGLSVCRTAGDFFLVDDQEPRIVCWCHPLSATEVAVMHLWGPSAQWRAMVIGVIDALIARGFVTVRWAPGNRLSNAARRVTKAAASPDGTVWVALALAKGRVAAAPQSNFDQVV